MKLTAIILTRGDKDLAELKKSLNFCDEILVSVNSEIVNFAVVRNSLAKKSKGEWLLYIDDDEIVPSKLKDEILDTIASESFPAYAIPRRNFIFGKEMRHCGLWPDYVIRLIKKEKLLGWEGKLHEQPKVDGKIGYLKEPLIHKKHDQLSDMVDKTNAWSEIEADLMVKANHPKMNIFRFCSAGFREFWHRMIVQTAFLDGAEGVIYAMYQVFSRLISYSKLWEKQQS